MYVPTWPCLSPAYLFAPEQPRLPFPLNACFSKSFFVARYGIYQLFRALRFQQDEIVLVPDYHHGNEVQAIRAAGASIRFYRVRRDLEPDLEHIEELLKLHPRALYVTHFIGWPQPMRELVRMCRSQGMLLIEDCALSLLSELEGEPLGRFGHYSVFCLYKSLPVPNGGMLVQNRNILPELTRLDLRRCGRVSIVNRSAELGLEWLRSRSEAAGRLLVAAKRAAGTASRMLGAKRLPVGNTGFDFGHTNVAAARFSRRLLSRFDYEEIRRRRRENFRYLAGKLNGDVTALRADLPEGVCPLFFPLLVADKRKAAEALWARGIGVVEFWNEGDPQASAAESPDAHFLRRHVLEIPIHQDVSRAQLDYIAGQVLRMRSLCRMERGSGS